MAVLAVSTASLLDGPVRLLGARAEPPEGLSAAAVGGRRIFPDRIIIAVTEGCCVSGTAASAAGAGWVGVPQVADADLSGLPLLATLTSSAPTGSSAAQCSSCMSAAAVLCPAMGAAASATACSIVSARPAASSEALLARRADSSWTGDK